MHKKIITYIDRTSLKTLSTKREKITYFFRTVSQFNAYRDLYCMIRFSSRKKRLSRKHNLTFTWAHTNSLLYVGNFDFFDSIKTVFHSATNEIPRNCKIEIYPTPFTILSLNNTSFFFEWERSSEKFRIAGYSSLLRHQ